MYLNRNIIDIYRIKVARPQLAKAFAGNLHLTCAEALNKVLVDGGVNNDNHAKTHSAIFIPGGVGYIANSKHKFYNQPLGGIDSGTNEEGENILYLGGGKFWGFIPGKGAETLGLGAWENKVDTWGAHDTWDLHWTYSKGLHLVEIGFSGWWEDETNPYQSGATVGGWGKIQWPQ